MKFETLTATFKDGSTIEGKIYVPETLPELLKVYPEARVYKLGLAEYMIKAKKRLISKRSPKITLRLTDLTPEQQAALRKMGILDQG